MSPKSFNETYVEESIIGSAGRADNYYSVNYSHGIKPVINLKSNSLKSGDGTINNPYLVTPFIVGIFSVI